MKLKALIAQYVAFRKSLGARFENREGRLNAFCRWMGEEINVYLTQSGEKVTTLKGHQGGIYSIAFNPAGTQLAAAGFEGTVRIYDVKTSNILKAFIPVPLEGRAAAPNDGRSERELKRKSENERKNQ